MAKDKAKAVQAEEAEEAAVQESAVEEIVQEGTSMAEVPAQESIYTADELAEAHKVFGTSREIVTVALQLAGKETATFSEAKGIIDTLKNKEVK